MINWLGLNGIRLILYSALQNLTNLFIIYLFALRDFGYTFDNCLTNFD
jgi:hypothetical protein